MNDVGFDPTRWSYWLLIVCFIGVSTWGLYLSWQWASEIRSQADLKRKRAKLARRLMVEMHGMSYCSPKNKQVHKDMGITKSRRDPSFENREDRTGNAYSGRRSGHPNVRGLMKK